MVQIGNRIRQIAKEFDEDEKRKEEYAKAEKEKEMKRLKEEEERVRQSTEKAIRREEEEIARNRKLMQKQEETMTRSDVEIVLAEASVRFQRLDLKEFVEMVNEKARGKYTVRGSLEDMIISAFESGVAKGKYFSSTNSIVFDVNASNSDLDKQFSQWTSEKSKKIGSA